jgi:tetratricopeptide (TPR) repeat protein
VGGVRVRALVLLLLVSVPAFAEEDAKTLFERGRALYALRRFEAAAALYEKAFELRSDPAILYNAAQAHRLAGHKARALELYESLVRLYGNKLPNQVEIHNHIRGLRNAIEVERRATNSPPLTPMRTGPEPPPAPAAEPKTAPVPGADAAPALTAKSPENKPITRKAWFWGVIGGVAAVVVAGVTVGVVLGTQTTVAPTPSLGTVPGN